MADALREQQYTLARHVRDPGANPPPPGIEDRRLAIYRDLFFNSIDNLLAGNFPVIRRTLGDDAWRALVRRFYAEHRCRTPLFTEVGREFVQFLEGRDDVPPWLHELAHYEWVELALQISDEPLPPHDPHGDFLSGRPVLSPHAWALAYGWPVPRIGPGFQPVAMPATPTLLLVRRDEAGDVHFSQLSPLVFRLLQWLDDDATASGRQALRQLAGEAGAEDGEAFIRDGVAMLSQLHREGVVLGTVPQVGATDSSAAAATLPRMTDAPPPANPAFRPMAERFRGYLPVVVDVETGGFDWNRHALLEMAAVPLDLDDAGRLVCGATASVHLEPAPGTEIDPKSLEVTGIRLDHPFRLAKPEKEALDHVFAAVRAAVKKHHCQRAILVGHNAHFDLNFLNAAVARVQHKRNPFHPFSVFDTVTLAGVAYGQTVLGRAMKAAGLAWNGEEAHSAVYDAERTAELFCLIANAWAPTATLGPPAADGDMTVATPAGDQVL